MTAAAADSFVPVADVVGAVGLQGELKLYPLIDWYEPLLDADCLVWEDGRSLTIQGRRTARGGYVVLTDAAAGRDAAEVLIGRRIGFLRSRYVEPGFPRPAGGLPFRFLGRPVTTRDGVTVGIVDEVRRHGSQFTLVVPQGGEEILIPAVAPILVAGEGLDGPLVIDPPDGLLPEGSSDGA